MFLFFTIFLAQAQRWTGELDQSSDILLKNRYIEIEAAEAMYDMYNMDFDQAERQFNYLKKQYGWHPLPDFLLGLCYWWRMVPKGEMESKWDQLFLIQMDSAQLKAHRLYDEVNKLEGAFFLAAAYGFQGRLYGDRGQYFKASLAGKNALKYLNIGKDKEYFSPELLLGMGLFNYYAKWIPEHYPMLKPIMTFFPEGDKSIGIAQLKETLLGKALLDLGLFGDGTSFGDLEIKDICKHLQAAGYESNGNQRMYSGVTGEQLETSIFIGPAFYQRLKHMVSDKTHSRSFGPKVNMTRQPAEGRRRDGGHRFGEMERDCMCSHGASRFTKGRMMDASDGFATYVCKCCGSFAAFNNDKHIHMCNMCDNRTDFAYVELPYSCKLLFQELVTMNVAPRIIT